MVTLDVFTKSLCITYKTTLISKAAFVTFFFGIVTFALPFIFAYLSKGFWIQREVFYEQPDVKFTKEYIFIATTNNLSFPVISCSSIESYEKKLKAFDTCVLIRVREIDNNYDGKTDEFKLSLQVNLPHGSQITSVYLLTLLDYTLHVCPLQMQTAIVFQEFIPRPVFKYTVMSDVKVAQASPLICHSKHINRVYNFSILERETFDYFEINSIAEEYAKRNLSTTLKNVYSNFILGKTHQFFFDLTVRYPEDVFYYTPGFWQTIKWAWIQYLAIYILVSWFVTAIKTYIFSKKLVLFYEDNPFKKKQ